MSSPPYVDVFSVEKRSLSKIDRVNLLEKRWDQVQGFTFPTRYNGGSFRKAQAAWFLKYSWLRYSVSSDGVYCASCYLFGDTESTRFCDTPLTDWCNATKLISKHDVSASHSTHKIAADNFCAVMKGEMKDIECRISSQFNMTVERNRQILVAIVNTVLFCGRQNIALRGHNEDMGNFKALLHLQAQNDPGLKAHLESVSSRASYTSPNIQNELIGIIGDHISGEIVKACNNAGFFGFMADEATDSSTMEQMALCLRFVENGEVREEFIGFSECHGTTGEALATSFIDQLTQKGVNIHNMKGQGYDGASNMSGIYRGVQARIRQHIPDAVYTHCKAHCLNLAIIHACKVGFIRNMMDIVQTIAFAFNYSAKRLLEFSDVLENDVQSREAMDERKRLQSLCETRWAARADALHTFVCAYRTVVTSLENLAGGGDTKAAGYRLSVMQFSFIVTLVTADHVLSRLVQLSKTLQAKKCDLVKATTDTRVVLRMLQNERADDTVWEALYEKAVDIARDVQVEPSMARNVGRQQNRANAPAETVSAFWKTNMYLPFVDHLATELTDRLLQGSDRYKAQWLTPAQVKRSGLTDERCTQLFQIFRQNIEADEATFVRECQTWRTWWTDNTLADERPEATEDLCESITLAGEGYPNIRTILTLLIVVPVSTATAERSFSTMRRVKTYLRSTMGTERLSGLGLMNVYREKEICAEHIVNTFANRKERRLALIFNE